ncbi:MAG: MATE family efflux transporter [bacterium]|nr:MATE family efflux transporter [bacterium]
MSTVQKNRVLDMTKGNPLRLLLVFSLPVFLGNLLQQCYNLADISIAGHMLGDAALAQIGATSAFYSMITYFAFGLNSGFALILSRSFGEKNSQKMKETVCWMTILAGVLAVIMLLVFVGFFQSLLRLMQTPEDVLEGASAYIGIILLGIPLTMAYNLESSLLRAVGNSVTPLYFLIFSCLVNVGLDVLFIGPLGWGIRGAAAATVLAQGGSAILGFWYIAKNYPELRFGKKELQVKAKFIGEMLATGFSMALMSTIFSIGILPQKLCRFTAMQQPASANRSHG